MPNQIINPGRSFPPVDAIRLPAGELAVRTASATPKETELLHQTGREFELTLLLTQTAPGAGRRERGYAQSL